MRVEIECSKVRIFTYDCISYWSTLHLMQLRDVPTGSKLLITNRMIMGSGAAIHGLPQETFIARSSGISFDDLSLRTGNRWVGER
jgi:hypothetical protein